MASTADRKVIAYIADIQDIESKLAKLKQLNQAVSNSLGKDFAKNLKVVGKGYDKLGKVDTKKLDKSMASLIGTTTQTADVVKTANGEFLKLTKTTTVFGKKLKDGTIQPMARISTSVNNATESLSKFGKGTSSLIGKSSQLKTNLSNVSSINAKYANSLKSTGFVTQVVGKRTKEVSGNLTKFGVVAKTADGKFLKLTETVSKTANGVQKVQRSVKDVTRDFKPATKNTEHFGNSLKRLASRALLTIPVWFAIRGSISGLFRTIKSGLATLAEQDDAFQKARRNLEATAGSTEELRVQFTQLKNETLALSLQSGKSIKELTDAYQKFATVGFNAEESMAGMIGSTKLAVVEFGNAEKTAKAFARALRVLIDTSEGVDSPIKQMNDAFALTDQLWKKNAFDVDEFSGNLLKLAGTAKIAKLSIGETLTLLATVSTGALGASGGRLLTTGLIKSLSNLDEVGKQLNISFDPAVESTFQILTKIIGALGKLSSVEQAPKELLTTLKDLFRIRGTRLFATLTAMSEILKENSELIPDVEKLNKAFKNQNEQVGSLTKRFKNARKEIAKAFVTGIVGGEDYDETLASIVKSMEELITHAEALGVIINAVGVGVKVAFIGLRIYVAQATLGVSELVLWLGRGVWSLALLNAEAKKTDKELVNLSDKTVAFGKNLQKALSGKLNNAGLRKTIEEVQKRLDDLTIEPGLNREPLKKALPELEKLLKNNLEKIENNLAKDHITIKTKLSDTEEQDVAKLILKNLLEQAKAQGASEVQLLKIEQTATKRLGIEEDTVDALGRELSLQRAINEEKRSGGKISSDAVKLFRILEKDGRGEADRVADALADADIFGRVLKQGGETADILMRDFADRVEQFQATQAFKGEAVSGKPGLRGFGITLPTEDEALRKRPADFLKGISTEQRKAEIQFLKISNVDNIKARNAEIQEMRIAKMKVDIAEGVTSKEPISDTNSLNELFKLQKIEQVGNRMLPGTLDTRTPANMMSPGATPSIADIMNSMATNQQKFSFQSAGVTISINAKNAEDLDNQINAEFEKMKNETKEEIKDALVGKQSLL